jgi:hypothetical protein
MASFRGVCPNVSNANTTINKESNNDLIAMASIIVIIYLGCIPKIGKKSEK